MAQQLDYATVAVKSPEDRTWRRYFVYGMDLQTSRAVRVQVCAYGLTNLAGLLHADSYLAEMVVVDPDPAFSEPPSFGHYIDEATATGDKQIRTRVGRMGSGSDYQLVPTISRKDETLRKSLNADVLVRDSTGFVFAGRDGNYPHEGVNRLAVWGLGVGLVNLTIGLIAGLAILTFVRRTGPAEMIAATIVGGVYIIPGAFMIVMGLDQFKRQGWVPIVGIVLGSLLTAALCYSIINNMVGLRTPNILSAIGGVGLLALNVKYLFLAIAALGGRPASD